MRARQHIMCHHAVQATRIGDLDAIGEHADMHLRAARIGRIITVGERVRNRLAQHERRIVGFFAPIQRINESTASSIITGIEPTTDFEATNRSSPRNTSSRLVPGNTAIEMPSRG